MVTSWVLGRRDYDLGRLAAPVVELFLRGAADTALTRPRPALAAAVPASGGKR